jgi:colanic acid/amylovoran biosynthesis glycosyltransferase
MHVVHVINEWLPLTQSWLESAIGHLPDTVRSTIACRQLTAVGRAPHAGLVHVPRLASGRLGQLVDVLVPGLEPSRLADKVAPLAPDVLHAHFGAPGWDARAAAGRTGKPFVVSFYGLDVDSLPRRSHRWRARYRRIFDEAALVLALGPWMSERLVGHGADPGRIAIHHLGVPVAALAFRARSWDQGRPLRVLIASSFREKKGIPVAIKALARLRRHVPLAITLVGDASNNDPERAEKVRILDTIAAEGMADAVRQLGFIAHRDLVDMALDHDLIVAASRTARDGDSEGTPMTLVELAATGIIVVSTRHADIGEIVADEQTGFLADPDDPNSLVGALERAVGRPDRWPAIGTSARAHIAREFDAETQGQRLAARYRALAP